MPRHCECLEVCVLGEARTSQLRYNKSCVVIAIACLQAHRHAHKLLALTSTRNLELNKYISVFDVRHRHTVNGFFGALTLHPRCTNARLGPGILDERTSKASKFWILSHLRAPQAVVGPRGECSQKRCTTQDMLRLLDLTGTKKDAFSNTRHAEVDTNGVQEKGSKDHQAR